MFSKAEYKKNREAGKRGQGEYPVLEKVALWTEEDFKAGKCGEKQIGKERTSGVTMHYTKRGLIAVTRAMKRQKIVGRIYLPTKTIIKGFENDDPTKPITEKVVDNQGRKLTQRSTKKFKIRHYRNEEKRPTIQLPTEDPSKTNHQRMLERKEKRDADRAKRTSSSAAPATV